MPTVDLVDETFIAAPPEVVAAAVARPERWREWWPDLVLTVFMDRGRQGLRWNVAGGLHGSSELWLEPVADGVLVHYYLRADPPVPPGSGSPGRSARRARRLREGRARAWKRSVWALKDELEAGRAPGGAAAAH
jgi:hypothetical protein